MPALGGSLPAVLGARQIQLMEHAALDILERAGMVVARADVRSTLAGLPGVTIRGERVYLAAWCTGEMVAEWRQGSRARGQMRDAAAPLGLLLPSHAMYILDPGTDVIRPLTTTDVAQGARLGEALRARNVLGGKIGIPVDVPAPLQQIAQFKISVENSRNRALPAMNDAPTAEAVREMCRVVGCEFSLELHAISPLRMEGNEFDVALHLGKEQRVNVGVMPTAGLTAPLQLTQLFTQAMAEVFGGFSIVRLLGFKEAGFWINAYPANMRNLSLVFGSPEHILCDLMQLAINTYYGATTPSKAFLTMAKAPDMQAATDAAAHCMALALAGATLFHDGGSLSLDELWSPEKLLIDCEILAYVQHTLKGFEFDERMLGWEHFGEGIEEGSFVAQEATVRHFREVYWMPRLFNQEQLSAWQHRGAKTLRESAVEAIGEAMKSYDYHLAEDQQRELDRIYRHAEARLA